MNDNLEASTAVELVIARRENRRAKKGERDVMLEECRNE